MLLLHQLARLLACTGVDSSAWYARGQQAAGFHSFTLQKGLLEAAAALVTGRSTYVRSSIMKIGKDLFEDKTSRVSPGTEHREIRLKCQDMA